MVHQRKHCIVVQLDWVGFPPNRTTNTAFQPKIRRDKPILLSIFQSGPNRAHKPSSISIVQTTHPFWMKDGRLFNDKSFSSLFLPFPCVY